MPRQNHKPVKPPCVSDPSMHLKRILRRSQLSAFTGLSRSVLAELIRKGDFPMGLKLNPSAGHSGVRGWTEDMIEAWQNQRQQALKEEVKAKKKANKPTWFDKI